MGPGSNTVLRPPRCLLLCSVSLIALSGSALAADLPVVKVAPALAASWAGFYLGVHGGYGWGRDDFSQSEAFALATPQSVADAVMFLASARAAAIVGDTIVVDGGFSAGRLDFPRRSS